QRAAEALALPLWHDGNWANHDQRMSAPVWVGQRDGPRLDRADQPGRIVERGEAQRRQALGSLADRVRSAAVTVGPEGEVEQILDRGRIDLVGGKQRGGSKVGHGAARR